MDVDVNGDRGLRQFGSVNRYHDRQVSRTDGHVSGWDAGLLGLSQPLPEQWLTGLAPVFEVHVNQGLGHAPVLTDPQAALQIGGDINGNPVHTISIVDLTVGLHVELYRKTTPDRRLLHGGHGRPPVRRPVPASGQSPILSGLANHQHLPGPGQKQAIGDTYPRLFDLPPAGETRVCRRLAMVQDSIAA